MNATTISTPTGAITLIEEAGRITKAQWQSGPVAETGLLGAAAQQLRAYFNGDLKSFNLPLRVKGSQFQRDVCDAIYAIPYGEVRTYGDIAKELGASAQAVGAACGANPIPIIIPCHRVVGTGNLGGFSGSGGVETKVWLLKHEGAAGLLI